MCVFDFYLFLFSSVVPVNTHRVTHILPHVPSVGMSLHYFFLFLCRLLFCRPKLEVYTLHVMSFTPLGRLSYDSRGRQSQSVYSTEGG